MLSDIDAIARREDLDHRRKTNLKRRRIILFSILGVVLVLVLFVCLYQFTNVMFGLSQELESAPQSGDWVMFHRDQAHTGDTGPGASPEGTLKWTFTTGSGIHSSPAVVNGVVYFGSRDGYLYALDAKTGAKIWSFQTGSWVDSSPIVVSGVVYCGSNDGCLYALNANTGVELWQFQTRYAVRSTPAFAKGRIYVGSDDSHLYAVDASTGKELWNLKADYLVLSSPVVTGGIVIVGSMDGSLYALNAENGRHRLEFISGAPISSSPAVDNGVVYISDSNGQLYAIDSKARNWLLENRLSVYWNALWIYGVAPKPPPPSGFLWSFTLGFGLRAISSPAIMDGMIYIGADNSMISMSLADKKINWSFQSIGLDFVHARRYRYHRLFRQQ